MDDVRDDLLVAGWADYVDALDALERFRREVARRSQLVVAASWPGQATSPYFQPDALLHGLTWGVWLGVRWQASGVTVWAGLQRLTGEDWRAHAGVTTDDAEIRRSIELRLRDLAPHLSVGSSYHELGVRAPTSAAAFESDLAVLVRYVRSALDAG